MKTKPDYFFWFLVTLFTFIGVIHILMGTRADDLFWKVIFFFVAFVSFTGILFLAREKRWWDEYDRNYGAG